MVKPSLSYRLHLNIYIYDDQIKVEMEHDDMGRENQSKEQGE
jgi:hypothetical protein